MSFKQYLIEMPHLSYKNTSVDFYAEKDPKWIYTRFIPIAIKHQHDNGFIKLLSTNIFFQLAAQKSYKKLDDREKKVFSTRLNKKIRETLLTKKFNECNQTYYFKNYITENITLDNVPLKRGSQKVVIFVGRMQPPTKAHWSIIKTMQSKYKDTKTVIFVVKGKNTSVDRSPLNFNIVKRLIKMTSSNTVDINNIFEIDRAFLGTMLTMLRNQNKEPVALFCGEDREESYKQQLNRYKNKLNINMKIEVIERTDDGISATKVRDAIRNNNFKSFSKMTIGLDINTFNFLRKYIK
jgi:nicotinic acid mononucleotide adenylyltransferase